MNRDAYENTWRRWTIWEDRELVRLMNANTTTTGIATHLRRSHLAILIRIRGLGGLRFLRRLENADLPTL